MTLSFLFSMMLKATAVAAMAGLGLALFRVQSSAVKLAVWRLVLYASLLLPLTALLPRRAVMMTRPVAPVVRVMQSLQRQVPVPVRQQPGMPVDWRAIALRSYLLVAGLLALRVGLGLLRLRMIGAGARPLLELGAEVFETDRVSVPVTYGVLEPRILLPCDWRNWPNETLSAVLAHERNHIVEHDFLTQCLAKLNRAVYWANPLAWWLAARVAALGEHVSDDAALHRMGERPTYAAVLLHFAAQRGDGGAAAGVAMARAGGVSGRIDRILDDAHSLSRPLGAATRACLAVAAMATALLVGACKMSTVSAQTNPPKPAPQHNTEIWWDQNEDHGPQWALVTKHGMTMMNAGSASRIRALARRTAGDYLWFSRDGVEYWIDDAKTLADIESWFKPMEELGRRQSALGDEMSRLGDQMAKLGEEMAHIKVEGPDRAALKRLTEDLASRQSEVSLEDVGELQSRLGELEALLGRTRALADEKQAKIGALQGLMGENQGKLGELQGELGKKQGEIAAEAEAKLRRLIDDAVRQGLAKRVR